MRQVTDVKPDRELCPAVQHGAMKLNVLGTAGYHPKEGRHTTCVMVADSGLIFDAGTSMFRTPHYLSTDSVDILLSHAHVDHVVSRGRGRSESWTVVPIRI